MIKSTILHYIFPGYLPHTSCSTSTHQSFNQFNIPNMADSSPASAAADAKVQITRGEESIRTYSGSATDANRTLMRSFCINCGSPVYTTSDASPEWEKCVFIPSGTVDGIAEAEREWSPRMEFYCKRREEWLGDVKDLKGEGVVRFGELD